MPPPATPSKARTARKGELCANSIGGDRGDDDVLTVAAERRTKRTYQRAGFRKNSHLQRVVKNPVICSVSLIIAYYNLQHLQQALEAGLERLRSWSRRKGCPHFMDQAR